MCACACVFASKVVLSRGFISLNHIPTASMSGFINRCVFRTQGEGIKATDLK